MHRFFIFISILFFSINAYSENSEVFVNADILNIRTYPTTNSAKTALAYRGDILIIFESKKDSEGKEWIKVALKKKSSEAVGWVLAEYTVKTRASLLNQIYKDLDYSPQNKTDGYKNNPKVKVKGIYLTRYSSTPTRLNHFFNLVKGTEINAFVIDIKNERGNLLFRSEAAAKHNPAGNKSLIYKSRESIIEQIEKAKKNNLYLIARVVTFKDDDYAKNNPESAIFDNETKDTYIDRDKQRWVSPHNRKYWEYLIELCKEAADLGFNEIQFDYIRFTDWKTNLDFRNTERESKSLAIQRFLKYAREELSKKEIYVSADIFGLVASASDDLNLGQYWEGISNVVDFVSPMIYPSHFSYGFGGIPIPDTEPYKIVYISARDSVARNKNIETPAIIRPWIQDFTAYWLKGHINYEKQQLTDQIKALSEHGIDEYLLWNPKNQYKYLK
ncbi:MAG: putative glycoside hydrolase [bacterium]|jgi:hypothetical protein|nr:putative glycoside hydrolase [bacterium]